MSNQEEFLRYAEQCRLMMDDRRLASHRDVLTTMERAWRRLVDEEERIADLVRAAEALFSAPDASRDPTGTAGRDGALINSRAPSLWFPISAT